MKTLIRISKIVLILASLVVLTHSCNSKKYGLIIAGYPYKSPQHLSVGDTVYVLKKINNEIRLSGFPKQWSKSIKLYEISNEYISDYYFINEDYINAVQKVVVVDHDGDLRITTNFTYKFSCVVKFKTSKVRDFKELLMLFKMETGLDFNDDNLTAFKENGFWYITVYFNDIDVYKILAAKSEIVVALTKVRNVINLSFVN